MELKTTRITDAFGIKRPTLQDWKDRKLIKSSFPKSKKDKKQGKPDEWSADDTYRIRTLQRLIALGISRGLAKLIIEDLTFENVGPDKGQYKYGVVKRGWVENLESGKSFNWSMKENLPQVDFGKNEVFSFSINLLSIKLEVDSLLEL